MLPTLSTDLFPPASLRFGFGLRDRFFYRQHRSLFDRQRYHFLRSYIHWNRRSRSFGQRERRLARVHLWRRCLLMPVIVIVVASPAAHLRRLALQNGND